MSTSTKIQPAFRTFFLDDTGHNALLIKSTDKTIAVYLKLATFKKRKRIGLVTKSTKTISMRRERHKHLYIKGNAYGFNDYVLRYQTSFTHINLSDEHTNWKVPVSFILDDKNGFYLQFKEQGFEKQKFISLRELAQFEIKKEENRRL